MKIYLSTKCITKFTEIFHIKNINDKNILVYKDDLQDAKTHIICFSLYKALFNENKNFKKDIFLYGEMSASNVSKKFFKIMKTNKVYAIMNGTEAKSSTLFILGTEKLKYKNFIIGKGSIKILDESVKSSEEFFVKKLKSQNKLSKILNKFKKI